MNRNSGLSCVCTGARAPGSNLTICISQPSVTETSFTKTPGAIVEKYNKAIDEIMQLPKVREVLAGQGLVVTGGTPDQLDSLVKSQIVEWGKVVEDAKIPGR